MGSDFSYEKTLKTPPDNSFFNLQSYLFITSKQITRLFYHTGVSPHFVILLSMIFGIAASYLIIQNDKAVALAGAILLFYKNVLDKVDGSLARAKGLDSRRGRFYDSISDFIVTLTAYTAITYKLYHKHNEVYIIAAGISAMVFSMLQCSYFIYYQVSFIKISGKQTVNRLIESVTPDDINRQDKWTTFLQRVFMLIYGWQDMLIASVDNFLYKKLEMIKGGETLNRLWYQHKPFLTMASSLSIGTHIFLICLAAVFDVFEYYLFVNLILMNLLLILSVIYHYKSTKKQLLKP